MNNVRRSGLKLLLAAGTLAAIVGAFAFWLTSEGWQIVGYGWGIPGAFALAGLVQMTSGVPFSELSSRWDELQGWQRGILGTIIFILAVGLIIGALLVFATLMWGS